MKTLSISWQARAALLLIFFAPADVTVIGRIVEKDSTFCNPLNLNYRFSIDAPHHRSAADPIIVLYKNDYYLFASSSGGYWYSSDLRDWTFVVPEGLPLKDPAPALLVQSDRLIYTAHKSGTFYSTDDPKKKKWTKIAKSAPYPDPAFFQDGDGKVYLYYGAAFGGAISVVELDPNDNFRPISKPSILTNNDTDERGWERAGEDNLGAARGGVMSIVPWIEAPWITKHEGTYYLQYSAPGTIWKTYADGVFTSKSPRGTFTYMPYSPFSHKPAGFVGSAGHGAMFQDKQGRHWRVVTMVISVTHRFERRIGIFPAGFDRDGVIRVNTYLGDYPQFLPGSTTKNALLNNRPGWMLLSYKKSAKSSSALDARPLANAFDEDIRTYWSARTGDKGEWLSVDLGHSSSIHAVQINYAEHETKAVGRQDHLFHQYTIETSNDGEQWTMLVDKSRNLQDVPHDYVQLEQPQRARFVRLTNIHTPAGGTFAVRDLRVFGTSKTGTLPAQIKNFSVRRNADDERSVTLGWQPGQHARGYVVRYGIAPNKLYNNYQVLEGTSLTINSLNRSAEYYFTIDAFNENGVTAGKKIERAYGLQRAREKHSRKKDR